MTEMQIIRIVLQCVGALTVILGLSIITYRGLRAILECIENRRSILKGPRFIRKL